MYHRASANFRQRAEWGTIAKAQALRLLLPIFISWRTRHSSILCCSTVISLLGRGVRGGPTPLLMLLFQLVTVRYK